MTNSSNTLIETIHTVPVSEVYSSLKTQPQGLSQEEVDLRLGQVGRNALQEIKGKPLYLKFLSNFTHLMAILLWIGGLVAFFAQMPQLGIAVWMVNIINGAFAFWQEYRAEKATEALKRLLPTYTRVLRDGEEKRVPAEELVPGDVILLAEGDRVSADARLVQDAELRLDQSTLTGESRPVRKSSDAVQGENLSTAELPNLVFAGTTVASGTGKAVVFTTGMHTQFGKIANLTQTVGEELSPLQKEMSTVTKVVSIIAIAVGVVFFVLAVTLARITLAESFIFALGMIVAFVPEGLLPTVTLALAMGSQRMARRHALIKQLSAVETLGCTTVICTDKTGTLTQNEMTVRELWSGGARLTVTGTGYNPHGQIVPADGQCSKDDLTQLLRAAGLCNNSRLLPPNGESSRWSILGDPTEAALKVVTYKAGIELEAEEKLLPRWREFPFDSRRKRMSTLHTQDGPGSGMIAFTKGAPKEVLELCTYIQRKGNASFLDATWRAEIMSANDDYARNGLRVLAVAYKEMPFPSSTSSLEAETVEKDLTFLGLVAMMDPPRAEVAAAVEKCQSAGIRVVMITGDYGLTAESIASKIGILRSARPRIVTGIELDTMDEDALKEALNDEVLFARVAPEHKLRIVSTLQNMGHVVAVTGDGVNDAPALKKADIGIAMGLVGTDVAKEAADMILTDDNFASIVSAVEEGRAVYANIRKFTTYIFTSNTPEAVPFILYALSGARIPLALNVMHILSVDLGTDMVPAMALGAEPPEPGVMDRPPRDLNEHVITRFLLVRAYFWLGIPQSLAVMAAFYFMYWTNGYWGQWLDLPSSGSLYRSATAMAFAAVVMTQIGNLFAQRSERVSTFGISPFNNSMLWVGISTELVLAFLITYVPFFQNFVGTNSFPLINWFFLFALAPLLLILDELRKWLVRRRS
jgi:Ca2+-transporting ATPase